MDNLSRRIAPDLARLRESFAAGRTRPLDWRRDQLARLDEMCRARADEIAAALQADLGKPDIEALTHESAYVALHARHARRRLRSWARPRRMPVDLFNLPGRAWLAPEPRGPVLILAPWDYPWHLALTPLIGALAAGNPAVIKPSERAPATSALLARLVPQYLDPDVVQVIEGGASAAEVLLAEPWGLVFFTGSTRIGRKVAEAAGRTLSPVVLELGGKNPAIVAPDADIALAARRIAWGKLLNAGQTCVAPDHVLIAPGQVAAFVAAYRTALRQMLRKDPQKSADYGRLVDRAQFDRLAAILTEGEVAHGGRTDPDDLHIEPTLLTGLPDGAVALEEEVFGPILPLIEVDGIDAAIARINAQEKPLAVYLFSSDKAVQARVARETSSGALVLNDVVIHLSSADLPFGGVGASGMGAYHGKTGFDTFSHLKPVLKKTLWPDPRLRYPPYSERKRRWFRRIT